MEIGHLFASGRRCYHAPSAGTRGYAAEATLAAAAKRPLPAIADR
jgi:hypothetical protein